MNTHKGIYSFDKIEILIRIPNNILLSYLDIDALQKKCRKLVIIPTKNRAKSMGYLSKLIVTVPSNGFFRLLATYDLNACRITYIEIAKDMVRASIHEAKVDSYRLITSLRKKYTSSQFIYNDRDSCKSTKVAFENGMFSDMTGYFGTLLFRFVIYARFSKINNVPCIHSEWRIRGAYQIYDRTGIETIKDFITFDLQKYFEDNVDKYIVFEEINLEKLGMWVLGWKRMKNPTKRQVISIGCAAMVFLNANCISTSAQLADWFKKNKNRIESKRGRRSLWDKHILSVQSNSRFSDTYSL